MRSLFGVVIAFSIVAAIPARAEMRMELERIAADSLRENIVELSDGPYLSAGARQFAGFWTRDFAFATRGLHVIGRSDVVRHQLTSLVMHRRPEDGLVPRVLDSIRPAWVRVLLAQVGFKPSRPLDGLHPEYKGEHGTEAEDSNLLVLLAARDYVRRTGDVAWWYTLEHAFVEIFRYYDSKIQDLLVVQGKYGDWQDSVRRNGRTFYLNLLYALALQELEPFAAFDIEPGTAAAVRARIRSVFFDSATGLYRSVAGAPQISVDGNLLALDLGFIEPDSAEGRALYAALRRHPLWTMGDGYPGAVTYPDYVKREVSWTTRLVGLRHYHDRLVWSWLMGLSAKVAIRMGDAAEGARILDRLQKIAKRDGAIAEIYAPKPGLPFFRSKLYRAEIPFSWGAGFVLDALVAKAKAGEALASR